MASKDQMAIAREAREKELQERLASMEALLVRQSEQLDAIMTQLGIGQTELNQRDPDQRPADGEEPKAEVTTGDEGAAESDMALKMSILSGTNAKTEKSADDEGADDKPAGKKNK